MWEEGPTVETLPYLGSNPDLLQLFPREGTGYLTRLAQFLICKMKAIKSSYVMSRSKGCNRGRESTRNGAPRGLVLIIIATSRLCPSVSCTQNRLRPAGVLPRLTEELRAGCKRTSPTPAPCAHLAVPPALSTSLVCGAAGRTRVRARGGAGRGQRAQSRTAPAQAAPGPAPDSRPPLPFGQVGLRSRRLRDLIRPAPASLAWAPCRGADTPAVPSPTDR